MKATYNTPAMVTEEIKKFDVITASLTDANANTGPNGGSRISGHISGHR